MAHDASVGSAREGNHRAQARGKYWWLRWALLGVALIVLAVEAILVWDQLAKAWMSLLSANLWWVLAAIAAALASMHSLSLIHI